MEAKMKHTMRLRALATDRPAPEDGRVALVDHLGEGLGGDGRLQGVRRVADRTQPALGGGRWMP